MVSPCITLEVAVAQPIDHPSRPAGSWCLCECRFPPWTLGKRSAQPVVCLAAAAPPCSLTPTHHNASVHHTQEHPTLMLVEVLEKVAVSQPLDAAAVAYSARRFLRSDGEEESAGPVTIIFLAVA